MESQLVSVIIPAFNAEAYIAQAIESVLAQTYLQWELVVVNDGSTDNTQKIVTSFADARIRLINQENHGLGEARNTGIRVARSETIALLDSDDMWEPEFLEKMVNWLARYPEAAAVYCGFQYINGQGQPVGKPSLKIAPPEEFHETVMTGNWLVPCAVVFRKQLAENVGLFDGSLWGVEDTDMWARLSARYMFVGLPEVLVRYRIHDNNMSKNPQHMLTGVHRLYEKWYGPPEGDVLSWSEPKRRGYTRLYRHGVWAYLAYGDAQKSAGYFQQLFAISFSTACSMHTWRTLVRVHLPVEYRNDPATQLDWELAHKDIEYLLNELATGTVTSKSLRKHYSRLKGSAFLALAEEAVQAREWELAYRWLWRTVTEYPAILLVRPYWGTIIRGIVGVTNLGVTRRGRL